MRIHTFLTLTFLCVISLCDISQSIRVCKDEACVKVAKRIAAHLNDSVPPCKDFYNFACGGWMKDNTIPHDKDDFSAISEITKNNENILKKEIAKIKESDHKIIKSVKRFFKSCNDTDEIERLGNTPVRNFVHNNYGWSWTNFAKLGKPQPKKWKFTRVLSHIHRNYPAQVFFTVGTDADPRNKTRNMVTIDQAKISLPQISYMTNVKAVDYLTDYTTQIVLMIEGLDKDGADEDLIKKIRKEMKAVAHLEFELAQFSATKTQKEFALTSLKNLTKAIEFPWLAHIQHVLAPREITEDYEICVMVSGYLENLMKLLNKTPKTTLRNFMMWRLVKDQVPYLSKKFVALNNDFRTKMTGVSADGNKTRSENCFKMTSDILGPLVGAVFIRVAFREVDKKEVEEMMTLILKSFRENLKEKDWIDKETKSIVLGKLKSVVTKVGYPNYLWDKDLFQKRYEKLEIKRNDYYNNVKRIDQFSQMRTFEKLDKATDPHQWVSVPQMVNAFYVVTKNEVVIPAGILQPPFFYGEPVPRSISYGAIGHVLGHELTHGFDNTGRNFDKSGTIITKKTKAKGWSPDSVKNFNAKAEGLVRQFNDFKIESSPHPVQIDGKNSLGENIADGGGVKLAYMAYQHWVKENKEEASLPNLKYTNNQLFFIGYAQKECHLSTSKSMKSAVDDDVHAPSMFRIIGTLSNSEFFAKAFQCKETDAMHPKQKSQVWK